jgi:hypothetical protein
VDLVFFGKPFKISLERCQSGRMGRSRKPLYGSPYRGFESLSLRQILSAQSSEKSPFLRSKLIDYIGFLVSDLRDVLDIFNKLKQLIGSFLKNKSKKFPKNIRDIFHFYIWRKNKNYFRKCLECSVNFLDEAAFSG